jgi:hypothetical protein
VVHAPECPLEVRVRCIYAIFLEFSVLIHHDVGCEVVVYLSVGAKAVRCVTEIPVCFCCVCAYICEYGGLELEDAVHEGDWAVI